MTNENDWVTQDVMPDRNHLDEWRWVSTTKPNSPWNKSIEETHFSHGHTIGNAMFEVRCKRKDLPLGIGSADKKPLPCGYCSDYTFKGWHNGKCPYCGRVRGVCSGMVSQDELNAATRTRAWTFGTPAQTGHFLISFLDPALGSQEITATSIWNVNEQFGKTKFWFIYLGQTSDFADPIVQKAKYTLLTDPKEPNGAWLRRPDEIQDALSKGWLFVTEREFEVPEWD
jgi:hypothetical protein